VSAEEGTKWDLSGPGGGSKSRRGSLGNRFAASLHNIPPTISTTYCAGLRVLIVDDSMTVLRVTSRALADAGIYIYIFIYT
jgi:PleD family two-component response regulator